MFEREVTANAGICRQLATIENSGVENSAALLQQFSESQ